MPCTRCTDNGLKLLLKAAIFSGLEIAGDKIMNEPADMLGEIEQAIAYLASKCVLQHTFGPMLERASVNMPELGPVCPCKLVENLATIGLILLNNKFILGKRFHIGELINLAVSIYASDIIVDLAASPMLEMNR